MTYKIAQQNILTALQNKGWTTSQGLKINHAVKANVKLWFKPQSIYFNVNGTDLANAHSLHLGDNIIKQLGSHPDTSLIEAYLLREIKGLS